MSTYIAAASGLVEDEERLRSRLLVYRVISLLRRALRSWQKFKVGRIESALAVLEAEIASLPCT